MKRESLLLSLLFSLANAASQCYYPNGNPSTEIDTWQICDPEAEHSACCAIGDECLTNGLCRNSASPANKNDYWRDLCTDPTWESDACPKFCYNETTSPTAAAGPHFVEACSDTTWCCGDLSIYRLGNHFECCNDPTAVFDGGVGVRLSGPTVFTQPVAKIIGISTMTPSPSSTNTNPNVTPGATDLPSTTSAAATGLSSAAKAGIGAGAGVAGVLIVLALGAGLYLSRTRRANREGSSAEVSFTKECLGSGGPSLHIPSTAPGYSPRGSRVDIYPKHEMGHDGMINEAPASKQDPSEMSAVQQEVLEMDGSMYHRT